MTDDDISLDEKRVYADQSGTTTAFVATDAGVARVGVSEDIVGEFTLEHRGPAVDVTVVGDRVAIATPDDVLVDAGDGFVETGFGPATAVGHDDDGVLAAGDGRIARYNDGWRTLCELADVRAIEGSMAATATGVYRLDGSHLGLEAANDLTTAPDPLVATGAGLYYLANGWMDALDGAFEVAAGRHDGRAHAATADALYERSGSDGDWTAVDVPVDGSVADVAYGDATYAVTGDGTVLVDAGDGWRYRSLGLPGASAIAVVRQ